MNDGCFKKKGTPWNKGVKIDRNNFPKFGHFKKHSAITKKKISKILKERKIKPTRPYRGRPWNFKDGKWKERSVLRRKIIRQMGDDYNKIRVMVYMRDGFCCRDCGKSKKYLDVHHIVPFFESFDNSLNNLISLCKKCHAQREKEIIFKEGDSN